MKFQPIWIAAICSLVACRIADCQDAQIRVDASRDLHRISRLLTGVCIEDVNHEIYGGIYSQMIFGESFQEPALPKPIREFKSYGGEWRVEGSELLGSAGDGPKLVSTRPDFKDGEISVEIFFENDAAGNSGLIVRMANPGVGADNFDGYEVTLSPSSKSLIIGRHRHNWNLIREVPCKFNLKEWVRLKARVQGSELEVWVNDERLFQFKDGDLLIPSGTVALRQWQRVARYRNLQVKVGEKLEKVPFEQESTLKTGSVSGMWRATQSGGATGNFLLENAGQFVGNQSQVLTYVQGSGAVGIENRGLNREGMHFVAGNLYEGILWARADEPVEVWASIENADGTRVLDEIRLNVSSTEWQRHDFKLTPKLTDSNGRFSLQLKKPGSLKLGYVSLQPGPWGRFKNLPVRRDIAEALVAQGNTVMRYGGSMVNVPTYRWKNMIGPRERRQPYSGHWYPYSTNGWGILDFMDFCEAAGFEYIPTFHFGESPDDMADFIRYAKGSAETEWGQKRVRDGHPKPYALKYLQLGNEERVDLAYADHFEKLAKAIWDVDPEIILVVGDFVYNEKIVDPFHFNGAASNITSLEGQQKILKLAKQTNHEVWFDVHVWTDGPIPDQSFDAFFVYKEALAKLADGAKFKVLTFEFNANSHGQQRAVANALAIQAIERDGQIPIATSANALQPDGQNDNGWDQGLLFLNPSKVWLQPPGYVTQMFSQNHLPRLIKCDVTQNESRLDCNARLSDDGRTLVMSLVNPTDKRVESTMNLAGFTPTRAVARITELAAARNARNTADNPKNVEPNSRDWTHLLKNGETRYVVPAYSVTIIRWE